MKDGVGTEVRVGDTVAYIMTSYGGAIMLKGVVTKINPKTFWVKPLKYAEWDKSKNLPHLTPKDAYILDNGNMIVPKREVIVKPERMVVLDGHDWPEYQLFLNLGVVQEPLDNPF